MNKKSPPSHVGESWNQVVEDARALIAALGDDLNDTTLNAKTRLEESLNSAKRRYNVIDEKIRQMGSESFNEGDRMVREHPYHALGISFIIGLLFGLLFRKK